MIRLIVFLGRSVIFSLFGFAGEKPMKERLWLMRYNR